MVGAGKLAGVGDAHGDIKAIPGVDFCRSNDEVAGCESGRQGGILDGENTGQVTQANTVLAESRCGNFEVDRLAGAATEGESLGGHDDAIDIQIQHVVAGEVAGIGHEHAQPDNVSRLRHGGAQTEVGELKAGGSYVRHQSVDGKVFNRGRHLICFRVDRASQVEPGAGNRVPPGFV